MDEEKTLNMMLVYSSDYIYVYEFANANAREMKEVSFDLFCSSRVYGNIVSINHFTNIEDGRTVFIIMFEDYKVSTLHFNYKLACLETVTLHKLDNKESDDLLHASTSK